MANDTPFAGRWFLEQGLGGSPEQYVRVCEVTGIGGLGETNELIDVTTTCSGGTREYIGGLADGSEITVDANLIVDSEARERFISDVKDKATRSYRVVIEDVAEATILTVWFRGAAIGYEFAFNLEEQNAISFTLKVSGPLDITKP